MAKIVLIFIVLSQATFSIIEHIKCSKKKYDRVEISNNSLLIKFKDYLLAPIIVLFYEIYIIKNTGSFWVFVELPFWSEKLGLLLVAAGFALKLYAHRHLGPNWSSVVSIYKDHDLIYSGPYKIIRHPIYASYLITSLGVFFTTDSLVLFLLSFSYFAMNAMRANEEERFLSSKFGIYHQKYVARTNKFIPYLW